MNGWVGVDLDGTLAYYDKWRGADHIGKPIPLMVDRVKKWRAKGIEVRIFTARVSDNDPVVIKTIYAWCLDNIGELLPVTNKKDFAMIELWDDRCVQIEENTGIILGKKGRL